MLRIFLFLLVLAFSTSIYSQSKDKPVWWEMERNGKYLEVTSHLLFEVQSDSTRNQHADYLHIARNYGYLNDYEKAIFYLKKSWESTNKTDYQFRLYYLGTLAFFERDKDSLKYYMEKLGDNLTSYSKNNFKTLTSLYDNFDQEYLEASNWKN